MAAIATLNTDMPYCWSIELLQYELIVAPSIGQHIVGLNINRSIADILTGSRPPLQPHMGEAVGS